jgi:hypothetical protein
VPAAEPKQTLAGGDYFMALAFFTNDPVGLLASIKSAIDSDKIDTWVYDRDGDFTHSPPQWKGKAWLRPKIESGALKFGIMYPEGTAKKSAEVYAVYHGRFIEMVLAHFDKKFDYAQASANLQSPDVY